MKDFHTLVREAVADGARCISDLEPPVASAMRAAIAMDRPCVVSEACDEDPNDEIGEAFAACLKGEISREDLAVRVMAVHWREVELALDDVADDALMRQRELRVAWSPFRDPDYLLEAARDERDRIAGFT